MNYIICFYFLGILTSLCCVYIFNKYIYYLLKIKTYILYYCFKKPITRNSFKTDIDIYKDNLLIDILLINKKSIPNIDISKYSNIDLFHLIIYDGYYDFIISILNNKNTNNLNIDYYTNFSYILYIYGKIKDYLIQLNPYISYFKNKQEFKHLYIFYLKYKELYEKNIRLFGDLCLINYKLINNKEEILIQNLFYQGKDLLIDTFNLLIEFKRTNYIPNYLNLNSKYNISELNDIYNTYFYRFINIIKSIF